MKYLLLILGVSMGFLNPSYAHDEKSEYSEIGKAIEIQLKEEVDSDSASNEVKKHSEMLLKKFYKTKKIGRFWVKEKSE